MWQTLYWLHLRVSIRYESSKDSMPSIRLVQELDCSKTKHTTTLSVVGLLAKLEGTLKQIVIPARCDDDELRCLVRFGSLTKLYYFSCEFNCKYCARGSPRSRSANKNLYPEGHALCRRPLLALGSCPKLSFGRLGVSILVPGEHFGTSAAPWATMGAAGWTHGGPESDFEWFWNGLQIHFESVLGTEG